MPDWFFRGCLSTNGVRHEVGIGSSSSGGGGDISRNLGAFTAGETVTVTVWFKAPVGVTASAYLTDNAAYSATDAKKFTSMPGNGDWQQLSLTQTLNAAATLSLHLYGDMYTVTSSSATDNTFVVYDDVLVTSSTRGAILAEDFEQGISGWNACSGNLALAAPSTAPDQWKRDVIYLGGQAIAEVDAAGVHELHNDHLGSPRMITAGSPGMAVPRGAVEGRQVFGPYGEKIPTSISGYAPLTGYTGHLAQDPSGLTYMRGRFYSPAWHRFLNSDQGVDPSTFNQMAYVGGSPLQATDPSGMMAVICQGGWAYFDYGGTGGYSPFGPEGKGMTCAQAAAAGYFGGNGSGGGNPPGGGGNPPGGGGNPPGGGGTPPGNPPPPPPKEDPDCVNGFKPLVLKNAGSYVGTPVCGSGTCVDLLKNTMGNYPTATWVPGSAPSNSTPIGTFVATFYNNGGTKFANASGLSHVGAFNGFSNNGILLVDQYRNAPDHQIQNSNIRWGGTRNYNANASNYFTVMVPCK